MKAQLAENSAGWVFSSSAPVADVRRALGPVASLRGFGLRADESESRYRTSDRFDSMLETTNPPARWVGTTSPTFSSWSSGSMRKALAPSMSMAS